MVPRPASQVLLYGSAPERSREVLNLLEKRGLAADCLDFESTEDRGALGGAEVVACVINPRGAQSPDEHLRELLARAQQENVAVLVWGMPDNLDPPENRLIDCVSAEIGLHEIIGRVAALARCAAIVKQTEQELRRISRLGAHLNRYFEEIDQELRLAGRLQRDFLPRDMPVAGKFNFAQLYRPAAWVSGDIFDVFPIDGRHVGVFIADAMGHGTAAGLMTMFLRRALEPWQGAGNTGCIVPPAKAMHRLHEGLVRQDFPNGQFVTAAYALVDVKSPDIRVARGGHPYPLHISASGEIDELRCEGGLLGVAGIEPEFAERHCHLAGGDKVIFYTDGIEELFVAGRDEQTERAEFTTELVGWAGLDANSFVAAVGDHLDHQEGSLNPSDDVTIVVAEVAD